jgi:hypothetical protein
MIRDNIMNFLDVEMEIEDLAEFMFIKNTHNVPLQLTMGGLENNKDVYYFCLDLFCKGLVLLFSKDGQSVSIEELSFNDFDIVRAKMACAGIRVSLDVIPSSNEHIQNKPITNLQDISIEDDNRNLEEYKFILNTLPYQYIVSFALFLNV